MSDIVTEAPTPKKSAGEFMEGAEEASPVVSGVAKRSSASDWERPRRQEALSGRTWVTWLENLVDSPMP